MLIARATGEQGFEPRFSGPKPDVLPLDDSPRSSHILAREPDRERSLRRDTSISCFCKDSRTLFWGAQTPGRISAVFATACWMLAAPAMLAVAALLLVSSSSFLTPAVALASSAKTKPRSCAYANLRPTATNTANVARATLCLIDRLRSAYHLRPLRSNHELQAVAGSQATSMVSHDYFGDDSPSGQSCGDADRGHCPTALTPRASRPLRTSAGAPSPPPPPPAWSPRGCTRLRTGK